MNPIKFGEINYSSKYGKDALKARIENTSTQEVKSDSFNPKYKSKSNKKAAGIFTTIALMAATGIAAYKGKGKIQQILKNTNSNVTTAIKDFATKHPNLSQAGKSLKEAGTHLKDACAKPTEFVKKGANIIAKPFKAIYNGAKNIFSNLKNNK